MGCVCGRNPITAVNHFTVLSPCTIKDLSKHLYLPDNHSSTRSNIVSIMKVLKDMYVTCTCWTFFVFTIVNGIKCCFWRKHLTLNSASMTLSTKPFYSFCHAVNVTVSNNIVSFLSCQFNLRENVESSGSIACIWTIAASDVFKAVHQWLWRMSHQRRLLRMTVTLFLNVNIIQSMIPEDQKIDYTMM